MKDIRDWVDVIFKVVLAVTGVFVGYFFSFQKQQNDDIKLVVDMVTSEQSGKRVMGAAIAQAYFKQKRIPQEVYTSVYLYANVVGDQALRTVVNTDAAATSKEQPKVASALAAVTGSFPLRIYFHIRDEADRPAAARLKTAIESASAPDGKWIIVPGIELVPGKQTKSQLKCFKKAECQSLGPALVQLISANGVPVELSDQSATYEKSASIRPNHFEAWFAQSIP
jgi:hypothetical protein